MTKLVNQEAPKFRIEEDSLGKVEVPEAALWGAQTQRSLTNFRMGWERMPKPMIRAFGIQKKAAAETNIRLKVLDVKVGRAIVQAADEVMAGALDKHFPLRVWQTGSGTQTNMNANEVIANRASEILGGKRGNKEPVHPNDHVNQGQSSNDSFPTVMHIATAQEVTKSLRPALVRFRDTLHEKVAMFKDILKIGRTHLQDATPLTLGQEFSAYATQTETALANIDHALKSILALAQGGTAVGTGLNTQERFDDIFAEKVSVITGLSFHTAQNKFEALASHDALLNFSAALNGLATFLMKFSNDIRLLASGPRCGLGELSLPVLEPGSSIMPGKVNPTQAEALSMIAAQVMGNHTTITMANSQGHLQLNVYKPVIIYNLLQSIQLLADGLTSFQGNCLAGIEPNRKVMAHHLKNSLMLVTALSPHIGYDKASEVAKKAFSEDTTLKEAALSLGYVSGEEFDRWVQPQHMLHPNPASRT